MIFAEVWVLPVPGGPCTARYEPSRSSNAAVTSVAVSPLRGSARPLTVRGGRRSRMSVTASAGSFGRPADTAAAVLSMEACKGLVLIGGPGVSANGTSVKTSPSLGWRSVISTSVGASGLSQPTTVALPKPRRSGSSDRPAGAGGA